MDIEEIKQRAENGEEFTVSQIAALLGVPYPKAYYRAKVAGVPVVTHPKWNRPSGVYGSHKRLAAEESNAKWEGVFADIPTLSTGGLGAFGEMLVAADLLKRGVAVYRALHSWAPYDLVASHGDVMLRVEVKYRNRTSFDRNSVTPHWGSFDVLAVVTAGGAISYTPDIFSNEGKPVNSH